MNKVSFPIRVWAQHTFYRFPVAERLFEDQNPFEKMLNIHKYAATVKSGFGIKMGSFLCSKMFYMSVFWTLPSGLKSTRRAHTSSPECGSNPSPQHLHSCPLQQCGERWKKKSTQTQVQRQREPVVGKKARALSMEHDWKGIQPQYPYPAQFNPVQLHKCACVCARVWFESTMLKRISLHLEPR